jgi:uncharacterized SAM-binding protein YcdF (DUF218 family)
LAFFAYKLAGSLIVPPGLFVLALVVLALSLARKKNGKGYAAGALLLALGLYAFSTPAGARLLAGDMEDVPASLPPAGTKAAILVLGGGVSYGGNHYPDEPGALATLRLLAALEAAKTNPGPVIVTGGLPWKPGEATTAEVMAKTLRRMGFKGEILMAGRTRTTREDLVQAGEIMQSLKLGHLVLVTNAFHMKRALWLAARHVHGAVVHPFPAGHLVDRVPLRPLDFLPTADMAGPLLFRERVGLSVERLKSLVR